jgi:hypothetical protein
MAAIQDGEPIASPYTSTAELWGWKASDGRHHIATTSKARALEMLAEARKHRPDLTHWLASRTIDFVTVRKTTSYIHEGI